jgi:hypothetical protein
MHTSRLNDSETVDEAHSIPSDGPNCYPTQDLGPSPKTFYVNNMRLANDSPSSRCYFLLQIANIDIAPSVMHAGGHINISPKVSMSPSVHEGASLDMSRYFNLGNPQPPPSSLWHLQALVSSAARSNFDVFKISSRSGKMVISGGESVFCMESEELERHRYVFVLSKKAQGCEWCFSRI